MFYLLKAIQNPSVTQMNFGVKDAVGEEAYGEPEYGLFQIENGKFPEPLIIPENTSNRIGFYNPSDLGKAIGKFFRKKYGNVDSIEATEMIELVNIPRRIPDVDWNKSPIIFYDMFGSKQYIEMMTAMTKELDGQLLV